MDFSAFLARAEPWSGLRLADSQAPKHNILIVDDTVNSGSEIKRVQGAIRSAGIAESSIRFGAVYASPEGVAYADTYAELLPLPRVFEWNIMNHKDLLANACMDIDGVLCPDPSNRENDDGPRYRKFLSDTELRYKPSSKVAALVTSRLEMYRPETEGWLARHGVSYDRLIMLDLPSAEERRRMKAHAPHKAKAYSDSGTSLFIESSEAEAREIFEITGKPVFATDTREFFGAGGDLGFLEPWPRRFIDKIKTGMRERRLSFGPPRQ
jgi:uncharacterized HAD superfamily protein